MGINPINLSGNWDEGWALDYHIISSEYIGDDEFGNPRFNTIRTDVGELIYQLKYRSNYGCIEKISNLEIKYMS